MLDSTYLVLMAWPILSPAALGPTNAARNGWAPCCLWARGLDIDHACRLRMGGALADDQRPTLLL